MNLGQALPGRNYPLSLLPSELLLAHLIPPLTKLGDPLWILEQCLVFRNGLIRSLERKVGGVVGQVEKEGLAPLQRVIDVFERHVGEILRGVEILFRLVRILQGRVVVVTRDQQLSILVDVAIAEHLPVTVDVRSDDRGAIKAPILRKRMSRRITVRRGMPLAAGERRVAHFLQRLPESDSVLVERAFITLPPIGVDHEPHSGLVLIETGEQAGARRAASRRVIHLSEAQTVLRKVIETRRFDLAAIAPEIRVAQVIGQNHDDVGFRLRLGFYPRCHQEEADQRGHAPPG